MKYKLKTKKAAAKRFKVKASGKVYRQKIGRRHLLENKNSKLKRNKKGFLQVSKSDFEKVRKMLPGL
ncbi:MAG: 50S ribosomal protein L35 [Candidatus Margulisbacteria bacterium]|nr:50S ribosomal protein L35 [Candidatus Margulisiibacteriota bacterium]